MQNTFGLICCVMAFFFEKATPSTIYPTKNAKEILIGRCHDYQNSRKASLNNSVDCNKMWELFVGETSKSSCASTDPNYQPLLNHLQGVQKIPKNKVLFWSGTKDIASVLAMDEKSYILETTFAGYVFNDISWCAESAQSCDVYCKNPKLKTNSYSFWVQASSMYAESAEGEVTVLLNGGMRNKRTAFYDQSTFALYELPRLKAPRITLIKVILVFDLKNYLLKDQNETCTQGSTLILKERVIAKNITFQCEERPLDLIMLQCFYHIKIPAENYPKICKELLYNGATMDKTRMHLLGIVILQLIVAKLYFL